MNFGQLPWASIRIGVVVVLLALVGLSSISVPTPALGQDPAAAPADPAGGEQPAAPKKKESLLVWFYNSLGWRYAFSFLFLSFAFVSLFIMNILQARRDSICPVSLIETFETHLNEKRYQEAYELAKNDESFLGHVLAAGLAQLSVGYAKAVEAMQEVAEDESMKIDHRLSYLSLIGSLSTMIGLLGTVDGMIGSFSVIAASPTTPKPSELATGISMAMMTTAVGLVLAIPAIASFNILKNRFQRLTLEVGIASENLMSRFENLSQQQ